MYPELSKLKDVVTHKADILCDVDPDLAFTGWKAFQTQTAGVVLGQPIMDGNAGFSCKTTSLPYDNSGYMFGLVLYVVNNRANLLPNPLGVFAFFQEIVFYKVGAEEGYHLCPINS